MPNLKLSLLGPTKLYRDDQPVDLSAAKAIALLGYLAVSDRAQLREHVTDLLWPDSQPEAARKNLRNTLWAIRKALGDEALLTDNDRLSLNDSIWLDVRRFEEATEALTNGGASSAQTWTEAAELYRGAFLDGLAVSDAPEFELWLSAEQSRLGQAYQRLLEAQVGWHRAAGDWAAVMEAARRALAFDNLQEPMYRALMEAHVYLGERHEALRHYETLRTRLARELGVEPLPATEALYQAIIRGEWQPPEAPPTVEPGLARHRKPIQPGPTAGPFVGRQTELAALDEEYRLASQGQTRVVLISGELGIGKSRLWQIWSTSSETRARSEAVMLETRCLDTTQGLPFAPLTHLFRQSLELEALLRPGSPVAPIWLVELSRLLPELPHYLDPLPAPLPLPAEEERRRLFEALTQILIALDRRPLVLFIDDLHWIDQASLNWLDYLVNRLINEPLLLIGAFRPGEITPPLTQVSASWGRAKLLRRLALTHLTLAESAQLLAALGGEPSAAEQLQRRSAGNPYFFIELYQAGPDTTPPALVDLIRARLNRIDPAARQVLQAAAVLKGDFNFTTLRRTSGRGEEETLDALEALLAAGLLVEQIEAYEFAHPLVATIVREDLSLARRSFLHRRAAEALETAHADHLDSVAGELAYHYAQAGRTDQAARYAQRAGRQALQLAAPAEAITFYQQALRLDPTTQGWLDLGQALMQHGDITRARQAMQQAFTEFELAEDWAGVTQACLDLAMSYMASGQGADTVYWAKRTLDLPVNPAKFDCTAQQARTHILMAAGGLLAGFTLAQAETHLVKAIELAMQNNLPEIAGFAHFELGNLQAQRGQLAEAVGSFKICLDLAQETGSLFQEVIAHNNLAYHALLLGEVELAEHHAGAGLAMAENYAFSVPRQYLYSTHGEIALAKGELDQAEQWFKQALDQAERHANQVQAANIQANLALVLRARGRLEEALRLLESVRAAVETLNAIHLRTQIELWLTELYLEAGERAAAQEALARAEVGLADSERQGLIAWAERLKSMLSQ